MDLNWSLLGQAPDIGQRFQEGMQQGRQHVVQMRSDNALKAVQADPTNMNALTTLAIYNPQAAGAITQMQSTRLKQAQMQATQRAGDMYNSGDVAGAVRTVVPFNPELADQYQKLDKATRERVQAKYAAAGPVLVQAQQLPYAQRKQFISAAAPALIGQGWTQQEIDGLDPNDQNLSGLASAARTIDQVDKQGTVTYTPIGPQGSIGHDAHGNIIGGIGNPALKQLGGQSANPAGGPPVGTRHPDAQGNMRVFRGGDYRDPSNWVAEGGASPSDGSGHFPGAR